MKKYLNKAIIYKELKGSWWISFLLLFLISTNAHSQICNLIDTLNSSGSVDNHITTLYGVSKYFTDINVFPLVIVILIIISQTIMGADKKGDFEKIAAMPFTRKETIISKLIVAELILIIPLIINLMIILSTYFTNYAAIHPYIKLGIIFKLFMINLLNYSALLIFFMLIQSIIGKKIAGSVLGAIFLAVPMGLIVVATFFTAMHLEKLGIEINISNKVVDKVMAFLSFPLYNQLIIYPNDMGYTSRVAVLICLICLFTVLIYFSYKRSHFERVGNVLMFEFLEPIFKIGTTVCSALTGFGFIYLIAKSSEAVWGIQEGTCLIIADVGLIVIGVVTYFLTNKYIKANRE